MLAMVLQISMTSSKFLENHSVTLGIRQGDMNQNWPKKSTESSNSDLLVATRWQQKRGWPTPSAASSSCIPINTFVLWMTVRGGSGWPLAASVIKSDVDWELRQCTTDCVCYSSLLPWPLRRKTDEMMQLSERSSRTATDESGNLEQRRIELNGCTNSSLIGRLDWSDLSWSKLQGCHKRGAVGFNVFRAEIFRFW